AGRPHFAGVLVKKGYATSIEHAFSEYLAGGRPAYVERRELPVERAIEVLKGAGALGVWAHPLFGPDSSFDETLEELVAAGISGIEAYYSRFDPDERKRLKRAARRSGIVATGGSDYHGTYKPGISVGTGTGDLKVPDEVISELKDQR